ncbi:cobyrinate a,c-diamide synthase [Granulosicoccus antarcticus]|uniref:Cobyrinate a,c-diamide synthase n=1 Tax=Granulosicoccus antarcticus IMCC3135 TaxID=1192854 RepID=A0A2Z2NPN2_9GAMM|nr:cobyrinate a,c-diamide synthase [Granulosicoccus antarcticus]ASJ71891.1 Hydrogenobyrinate a,c-diamide synthase [Granulosicoccus antarcticus IMCC3135]
MSMPAGVLISAPGSGVGKTTLCLGLLRALRDRGLAVQPFKCGPDYIDPGFHRVASGHESMNLDSWSMPSHTIEALLNTVEGKDFVVCEGAMGLFDGAANRGESGTGSAADIAAMTGWPVVLVLDVSSQAQSAVAVALGFSALRSDVHIAGVVLNRVASLRHEALIRDAMQQAGVRVLGVLPRNADIQLPERHLGLEQSRELGDREDRMSAIGKFVADHVDLDALLSVARPTHPGSVTADWPQPPGQRIALADDAAFSFMYPHLRNAWQAAGAELIPFSPLANEAPDERADVCWLPGGYPELHAGTLAAASKFRQGLQVFAQSRPVHGECGGYMAMGEALIDANGDRHEMAGLLGLVTSFERRRLHLGYRFSQLLSPMPGLESGSCLRGHEFHYSSIIEQPDEPLARVQDASGKQVPEAGSWRNNASGSFFHLVAKAVKLT